MDAGSEEGGVAVVGAILTATTSQKLLLFKQQGTYITKETAI